MMEEYLARFVPLIKPSKGFKELKSKVIDKELCCGCGTCAAFCNRIKMEGGAPVLVDKCTLEEGAIKCSEEGTCYDNCPFTSLDFSFETKLGRYIEILAAKSKHKEISKKAQDGGIATTLAMFALESGMVDAVIGVDKDEEWRAIPRVAKTARDLVEMAGTKYSKVSLVEKFGEVIREEKLKTLLVIGVGCQINGIKNLMKNLLSKIDIQVLTIGLFCFENFPYECLKEKIEKEFCIEMRDISKMDITKGKFIIETKSGKKLQKSVKLFDECVNNACKLCTNFTSYYSDISLGSIGSKDGWSTVILRSKNGVDLFQKAYRAGYLEIGEEISLASIEKVASIKEDMSKSLREKLSISW